MIISSPGYPGSVSGLVKDTLNSVGQLRADPRRDLPGRAVGCVATAYGWLAAVTTLHPLRAIVHALSGRPTVLGLAVNAAESPIEPDSQPSGRVLSQLQSMADDVRQLSSLAAARPADPIPSGLAG